MDGLLASMTSRQLAGWQAYAAVEPFGPDVDDLRHGTLMALLANAHRDPKKRPQPFEARDFMLTVVRPRMTPRAFRAQFAHLMKK